MQNKKQGSVNNGLIKKLQNTRERNILKTRAGKLNDNKISYTNREDNECEANIVSRRIEQSQEI